jgi:hypothetical protein
VGIDKNTIVHPNFRQTIILRLRSSVSIANSGSNLKTPDAGLHSRDIAHKKSIVSSVKLVTVSFISF